MVDDPLWLAVEEGGGGVDGGDLAVHQGAVALLQCKGRHSTVKIKGGRAPTQNKAWRKQKAKNSLPKSKCLTFHAADGLTKADTFGLY